MEANKDDKGDKVWNNHLNDRLDHKQFNEGFSAENIAPDYNDEDKMRRETTLDEDGDARVEERHRFVDADSAQLAADDNPSADNSTIEAQENAEKRDVNYDDPNRYPPEHRDQHIHRGNNPDS